MLQRVNEGQDGSKGHLMYGSCPGLHATQSSHLAPPHVQGGHELASACAEASEGFSAAREAAVLEGVLEAVSSCPPTFLSRLHAGVEPRHWPCASVVCRRWHTMGRCYHALIIP